MSFWTLEILNPTEGSNEIELDPSRKYTIGRAGTDILIAYEPTASRLHATLEFVGSNWKIVDELSANGTKVSGKSVNVAMMTPDVVASIGNTTFRIRAGFPTSAPPSAPQYSHPAAAQRPPAPAPVSVAHAGARPAQSAHQAPFQGTHSGPAFGQTANPNNAQPFPQQQMPQQQLPPPRRRAPELAGATSSSSGIGGLVAIGVVVLLVVIVTAAVVTSGGGSVPQEDPKPVVAANPSVTTKDLTTRRSAEDWLRSLEGDTDAVRVLGELDSIKMLHGSRFTPSEKATYARLLNEAEPRLRNVISNYQKRLLAAAKELASKKEFKAANEKLNEFEVERTKHGLAWHRMADTVGVPTEIAKARAEYLAQGKALYLEVVRDAAGSESVGMVEDAKRMLRSLRERVVLDAEAEVWLEQRLTQLDTNPMITVAERRTWKPASNEVRRPWSAGPGRSLNEPEDSDPAKPTVAKPGTDTPTARKVLPPNPLFPLGQLSREQYIFGMIESIRIGVASGKLPSRIFKRGNDTFQIQTALEEGLRLRHAEMGVTKMLTWAEMTLEEYDYFLTRATTPDMDSMLGLGLLALERRGDAFARKALLRARELNSSFVAPIDLLLTEYEGRDEVPAQGYQVFEGSLLHPEAVALILFERKVEGLLSQVEKGLGAREKSRTREAGEAAFQQILALGTEAVAPTVKLLLARREKLLGDAESATGLANDTTPLDTLYDELEKRRKHALELIENEQVWPYPYAPNDGETRVEVMKRVSAVREIWNDPMSLKSAVNPKFEELILKIKDLNHRLDTVDPAFAHHQPSVEADLEYLRQIANQKLSIRKYGKSRGDKTKIAGWQAILEENVAMEKEHGGKPTNPDAEAWEQLRITNDYRVMMGRAPLKMNFKLFWASKHHSQWCVERNGGQITHDSPGGPRGDTPFARCAHEGYSGGSGENIHMNGAGPSAQSSHDSWLSSSGHHRNILSANWTVMGNGRFQTIWTQNFGNADENKGNYESRGGQ